MLDSNLSAQELFELATNRPDLWPQIVAHPNCYPDLATWISQQPPQPQSELATAQAEPATAQPEPSTAQPQTPQTQPVFAQPNAFAPQAQPYQPPSQAPTSAPTVSPAPFQNPTASSPRSKSGKGLKIAIAVVTLLLVVALVLLGIFVLPKLLGKDSAGSASQQIAKFLDAPSYISVKLPSDLGEVNTIIPGDDEVTVVGTYQVYDWKGPILTESEQQPFPHEPVYGRVQGVAGAKGVPQLAVSERGTIPWAVSDDAEKAEPGEPGIVTVPSSLEGDLGVIYGGVNEHTICTYATDDASCQPIADDSQAVSGTLKLASTYYQLNEMVGAFPLDDAIAAVYRNISSNGSPLYLVVQDKNGNQEEFEMDKGRLNNLYEFAGFGPDWKTRVVPTPTTGLTLDHLRQLAQNQAGMVKVLDQKVFSQTRYGSQVWKEGEHTYQGMMYPLLEDEDYVLGAWGKDGNHPEEASGIVVFQRDGKEVSRFTFPVPSKILVEDGRIFAVSAEGQGEPQLFDYSTSRGTALEAAEPFTPNEDKDAIKQIDFGNYTSSTLDYAGKEPFWNFQNNKEVKSTNVSEIVRYFYPNEAIYHDLNEDGFLDAVLPVSHCYNLNNCAAMAYAVLWDNESQQPIFLQTLGQIRTKYTQSNESEAHRVAVDLVKVEGDKLSYCLAAIDEDCGTFKAFKNLGLYFDESNTQVYTWDPDMYQWVDLISPEGYTLRALPYDDAPQTTVKFEQLAQTQYVNERNGYQLFMGIKEGTDCGDNAEWFGLRCGYMVWGKKS